jgi:acetyl esterase/lipase
MRSFFAPIRKTGLIILVAMSICNPAISQDVLPLWPDGAPDSNGLAGPETHEGCVGNITDATLSVYRPDEAFATDAALLVVPGGGYGVVCMDHEGAAIAEWLNGIGVTVGVLKYRLPNGNYRVPLQDAQQALRMMRSRAESWNVAPNKIGIMGFSAGGHLASTIGTHFDEDFSGGKGDDLELSNRPDFMVLVYPVISMTDGYVHAGSRRNLIGEKPDDSLSHRFSSHWQVTTETPPTFLVHASDDKGVHPTNSTAFFTALKANGVPAELHLFERGGHGFAIAEDSPAYAWVTLFETWLKHTTAVDD